MFITNISCAWLVMVYDLLVAGVAFFVRVSVKQLEKASSWKGAQILRWMPENALQENSRIACC